LFALFVIGIAVFTALRASFVHASGVSHRVPWKQGMLAFAKLFF
jgi:hypothetical protein